MKNSIVIADAVFHHVHNKHFHGRVKSTEGEYDVMIRFNSYGYRDYEYPLKKPEGAVRIIVLGDSFVEAVQVELEDTFVKRLEKRLNEGSSRQRQYEVINLGIRAYSPILEYLVLKNTGLKFSPDLIVVCFYFNDISDDSIYSRKMTPDKDGLPLRITPEFLSHEHIQFWGKDFLRTHSRFYMLFRSQYYNMLIKAGFKKNFSPVDPFVRARSQRVSINPWAAFKQNYSKEDELAWRLTCKYLLGIKSLAEISRSKLILVIIPAPDQVAPYEVREGKKAWLREENSFIPSAGVQDRLVKFCRQNGIEILDLLPALRRASLPEKRLFFDCDGHFNIRGHRIVAQEIYDYIRLN